jgi:DNA-binding protein HU-beta
MNKAELIHAIADQTDQTKVDVTETLDALLEIIGSTLAKGEKLQLVGFGTFEAHHRASREGRNPQTGAVITIAESTVPKFSPGKALKDLIAESHKPKAEPGPPVAKSKKK